MLQDSKVVANVPAADLDRARRYYSEVLGLQPAEEFPGGLVYRIAGGTALQLYETAEAGKASHTVAHFEVADAAAEVDSLRAQGVRFEHYDLPGVTWDGDVAGLGEMGHAAWFKDSEGNILCVGDTAST